MYRKLLASTLVIAGITTGCDSHAIVEPAVHDEIVGSWVASGNGIAPEITESFRPRQVEVTFESNRTYAVILTDSAYAVTVLTGTWSATGGSGSIRSITLEQRAPVASTWRGIFQVEDSQLTFEVIPRSDEAAGVVPATVAGGFGSTSHDGVSVGLAWMQQFIRQSTDNAVPCDADRESVTSKRPCTPDWNPSDPKRK